ncbi:MAG: ATP synthase subunit I [Candidatus Wallbacteria bacterium]
MNETIPCIVSAFIGMLAGAFFFGGLWWTVKKGVTSKNPVLLFAGSLIIRVGVIITIFYFAAKGRPELLIACLCGFFIVNMMVKLIICPELYTKKADEKEKPHENQS